MRWILVCLVAANLAYFVVQQFVLERSPASQDDVVRHQAMDSLPGAERLVLLSEVQETELQAMLAAKARLKMASEAGAIDRPLCTLIGPFRELLKAEYFSERLQALDIVASVEQVEVPGEEGYWVYQASQLSRKAALRRLYEFQAKGIDSYIIPRGELENGISFGVYSSQEAAEVRREEIMALGYEAEIKSAARSYQEIWLVLQPEEARKADEELWLQLLNPKENVELLQNFCPTVASR